MSYELIKGTKTEQNLKEAFAGESMARNKYSLVRQQEADGTSALPIYISSDRTAPQ